MTALVTCIYNNLHGTPYGGRSRRDRYVRSLKVICQTGAKVFCFTSEADLPELSTTFAGIENLELLVLELGSLPFHARVQEVKRVIDTTDIFYVMRCFEVMWGKMTMLETVIRSHPELKSVFWIDAGLSHRDVISSKYSRQEDIDRDHSEVTFGLFTPRLLHALDSRLDGKLLVIGSLHPNNPPIPAKYNANPYADGIGLVGGLFGGEREKMLTVITSFHAKVNATLADNALYSEEGILSAVYTDHPELFKLETFETWYHEGWDERFNPELKNFSNIFDDILGMDTLVKKTIVTTMAFGASYRKESLKFIDTFLAKTTGLELVVFTDDIEFYNTTDSRVTFRSLELPCIDPFPYSIKVLVVSECTALYPTYDTIVYFDCDCYWTLPVDASDLSGLPHGLNTADNVVDITRITNPTIRHTVEVLRNNDEVDLHEFREAGLVFKVGNRYAFQRFLYEWQLLHVRIDAEQLAHSGECWMIGLASQRSGYPIHRIDMEQFSTLTKSVMTWTPDYECQAIL